MAFLSTKPKIIDPNRIIPELPKTYDNIIEKKGRKYNIDPIVVKKIIAIESNFNPKETTNQAYGLMQVMSFQLPRLKINKQQILKPEINIDAGSRILREMYNTVYNWKVSENPKTNLYLTLAAYNGGPTRLKRLIKQKGVRNVLKYMPLETQDYILKYKNIDKILQGIQITELRNKQELELAGVLRPKSVGAGWKASRPQWDAEDINIISNTPVLPVKEPQNNILWIIGGFIVLSLPLLLKKKKEVF